MLKYKINITFSLDGKHCLFHKNGVMSWTTMCVPDFENGQCIFSVSLLMNQTKVLMCYDLFCSVSRLVLYHSNRCGAGQCPLGMYVGHKGQLSLLVSSFTEPFEIK